MLKFIKKYNYYFITLGLLFVLSIGYFIHYVNDYYKANNTIEKYYVDDSYQDIIDSTTMIEFIPEHTYTKGVIFYPENKVEAKAYSQLAHSMTTKNVLFIVLKPRFHMSTWDDNLATQAARKYPNIKFVVAGHGKGGEVAAKYVYSHEWASSLALFGAISPIDLSATNYNVALVYGTYDPFCTARMVEENKKLLPEGYAVTSRSRSNHSDFANIDTMKNDRISEYGPDDIKTLATSELYKLISKIK